MSERHPYLFSLAPGYKRYLKEGAVGSKVRNAFKDNGCNLPQDAKISEIDANTWEITDGSKSYKIKDGNTQLNVYGCLTGKLLETAVILFACIAVFGVILAVYLIMATPAKDDSFSEVYFANHTELPGEMLVGVAYNIAFTVSASHERNPVNCTHRMYLEEYPGTPELLFHPVENQINPLIGSGNFMLALGENKTIRYTVIPEKEHVSNEIRLFGANLSYKQYLKPGNVSKELIELFNETNLSLSKRSVLSEVNEKRWDITDEKGYYAIRENDKQLNVSFYESKRLVVYVTCNNKVYDIFLWCNIKDKQEEKQEVTCNPPYIKVGNICCLDRNNNGVCDNDEIPAATQNETVKKEPAGKVNETGAETAEKEPVEKVNETGAEKKELEEDSAWCNAASAEKYGAGDDTQIEGVVEFKEKQMCHIRYLFTGTGGTTRYDWYFTKNDEEVYRVTTYPDGRVEETKVEPAAKESGGEFDWCEITAAEKYGAGGQAIGIEGVVEFKEKQMCHIRYFFIGTGGITRYDWYFTKNDEEVYRVTTYPDGRVEETKVV